MRAAVLEDDPRTGHQVFDRARGQDLAGTGQPSDARANMHGKAADVVAHPLALAGVDAGSDLEPRLAQAIADGDGAADGARRPVEPPAEPLTPPAHPLSPEIPPLP